MRNANQQELDYFDAQASQWWNPNGPLKTLHDINSTRLEFIAQHATLTNQRVLDVGCGGGILAESMASYGAMVTGIDLASTLIETAKLHAVERQLSINYQIESIENISKEQSESFDVVTCMEMLEHVPFPQQIVASCAQCLKPNGWLFVSTLNHTFKAKLLGVWAAEYLLRLLPIGTHNPDQFIAPHQLVSWGRSNQLIATHLTGLHYHPILRQASLGMPADVNYLIAFQKVEFA